MSQANMQEQASAQVKAAEQPPPPPPANNTLPADPSIGQTVDVTA